MQPFNIENFCGRLIIADIISVLLEKGFDISSRSNYLVRNKELGISLDPLKLISFGGQSSKEKYADIVQHIIDREIMLKNKKSLPSTVKDITKPINERYIKFISDDKKNLLEKLPNIFTFSTVKQIAQEDEYISNLIRNIDLYSFGNWSILAFNDRFQRFMHRLETAGLVKKFKNTGNNRIHWEKQ